MFFFFILFSLFSYFVYRIKSNFPILVLYLHYIQFDAIRFDLCVRCKEAFSVSVSLVFFLYVIKCVHVSTVYTHFSRSCVVFFCVRLHVWFEHNFWFHVKVVCGISLQKAPELFSEIVFSPRFSRFSTFQSAKWHLICFDCMCDFSILISLVQQLHLISDSKKSSASAEDWEI